jgi:GT2 family glycosyltransferase
LEANNEGVVRMVPVIVIPVLNRYDLLERCIKSIDYPVENLIIIDNGGRIAKDCLVLPRSTKIQNRYIMDMPSNLGVATSWNLGIKMTPFATGWILLNSDAHFGHGHLEKFYKESDVDQIHLAGEPGWCCAWIGSEVVKDVGLFCEAFHPAYFEDNDYERRATRLHKKIVKSDALVYHDNSSTLLSDPSLFDKNRESFRANMELFKLRNARLDAGQWDLQRRISLSWD